MNKKFIDLLNEIVRSKEISGDIPCIECDGRVNYVKQDLKGGVHLQGNCNKCNFRFMT